MWAYYCNTFIHKKLYDTALDMITSACKNTKGELGGLSAPRPCSASSGISLAGDQDEVNSQVAGTASAQGRSNGPVRKARAQISMQGSKFDNPGNHELLFAQPATIRPTYVSRNKHLRVVIKVRNHDQAIDMCKSTSLTIALPAK